MKRILLTIFLIILLGGGILFFRIYQSIDREIAPYGHLIIVDRNDALISLLPEKDGYSVAYTGETNIALIKNIIAIEDRRFYQHFGIDSISKLGVLWESLWAGRFTRGGSTITEQYVKNRYFPLKKRSVGQKIREGIWALAIELRYTKDEILRKYLETAYMGNGIYGIPGAIEQYFPSENIENLEDESIAEIIVRLRFPNLGGSSEVYKKQISERLQLKVGDSPIPKRERKKYVDIFPFFTNRVQTEISRYCRGEVSELHELLMEIPGDLCTNSYKKLKASIDKDANIYAMDGLEGILFNLSEKNVKNGAILVWSEKEKKVLVYIGNRKDAVDNSIDMIQRKRSVGSILKPFLYLMAFHSHDPNDFILDEKKVYETETEGISYISENYIPKAYGPVTLKTALGNSLNSAAVRLTEGIGVSRVYASLRSLGFPLDHDAGYYGYSIALGAIELSLENIVRGYRNLTNLKDKENFLLFDILSDKKNRSMTFGESSILNTSIPLAVKTGTSTDFHDNWAVGYNDDIIIGVWVGNADRTSMRDISGVTGAGPIFHLVAEDLIRRGYIEKKEVLLPEGIVHSTLCRDEKCFQKEISYSHAGYERFSHPASNIYYEGDFVTPLSREEKENWKIR